MNLVYIIITIIAIGLVNALFFFVQQAVDKKYGEPGARRINKAAHIILTAILCIAAAGIEALINGDILPQKDVPEVGATPTSETSVAPTLEPDGYLKLSFYDGSFSYISTFDQVVHSEDDVIPESTYCFFEDEVTPLVYITIKDMSTDELFEYRVEHLDSHKIGLAYGEYELSITGEGYQKYSADLSLTSDNKFANLWKHEVFLIPDVYIAHDVQICAVDKHGSPFRNCEDVSIGYPGFSLIDSTDENGIITEYFTLAKGEYLVYIEMLNISGRFVVNELTEDNSLITVELLPSEE